MTRVILAEEPEPERPFDYEAAAAHYRLRYLHELDVLHQSMMVSYMRVVLLLRAHQESR